VRLPSNASLFLVSFFLPVRQCFKAVWRVMCSSMRPALRLVSTHARVCFRFDINVRHTCSRVALLLYCSTLLCYGRDIPRTRTGMRCTFTLKSCDACVLEWPPVQCDATLSSAHSLRVYRPMQLVVSSPNPVPSVLCVVSSPAM